MRRGGLIFFFILGSCMNFKGNKKVTGFDKQGHRGCRSLMPENTIPGMIRAVELGVTTLEMDVVITKDKQVILSHEPFFNHEITTKPDGKLVSVEEERSLNIYRMTYNETKNYDVGLKIHPRFPAQQKLAVVKPMLSALIDSVEEYCRKNNLAPVHYNIETKCLPETDDMFHPRPVEFVDLLMKVILSKKIENRVTIQSFDFRTLQEVHKKYRAIPIGMLMDEGDVKPLAEQIKNLGFVPDVYSPHYASITKEIIQQCRDYKMKVIPWTVNNSDKIMELKKMGVDGIITDDPALFNRIGN